MNDVKALCDAPPNLPGLVQFLGAYHVPESGQISIVLEYMDGGSLGDVLQKVKKIPENILSKITEKVLHGLTHLHRKSHMVRPHASPAPLSPRPFLHAVGNILRTPRDTIHGWYVPTHGNNR